MEFDRVINERRSIRNFKKDNIELNVIDEIISAAILAPSAHNTQPWHYYVLTNKKKKELTRLIREYITNNIELTYYQKIMRKNINFMEDAPCIVLCYISANNCKEQDLISMGSSIDHLILKAVDLGFGTLWNGVIVDFEQIINKYFNIQNEKLISAIVIGYQNEFPEKRSRKNKEEVITYL